MRQWSELGTFDLLTATKSLDTAAKVHDCYRQHARRSRRRGARRPIPTLPKEHHKAMSRASECVGRRRGFRLALAMAMFCAAPPAAAKRRVASFAARRPRRRRTGASAGSFSRTHRARAADQDRRDRIVFDIRRRRVHAGGVLSEPARSRAEGAASRPADHGAQQGHRRRGSRADGGALRRRRDRRSRRISCCGRSAAIRCCSIIRRPATIIRQGVERLKASGTEVVLINPQYAPKIIAKGDAAQQSVDVITATARDERGRAVRSLRDDALLVREREACRSSSS